MSRDYEDGINLEQMTDADARMVIRQRLDELPEFESDAVDIEVEDGHVRLAGRVGTDGERQRIEQVLTGLGAVGYTNDVIVDRLARAERPEGADRARLEDAAEASGLDQAATSSSDTAEHLQPDVAGELYGTNDMRKAVEEGKSYNPPEGPFQEGVDEGERH